METRCEWTGDDPLSIAYHDQEWGVPLYDDRKLFEFLILDGAQAGLSWITILRKRENYRLALDNFNPSKIALYDQAKIESLLQNPGIIRNKLKIRSAIQNAQAFLHLQEEFGSFSEYLWRLVDHKPIINTWKHMHQIPASTPLSEEISKDLKKHGFNFVGPTIVYAFMQAIGMVNDHVLSCFRYDQINQMIQSKS